jgi:ferredoxin-NADP reductase
VSTHRTLRLVDTAFLGGHGRLLTFDLVEDGPLGFVGGQYLIVNTGATLPDGRPAKRAYSIVSADSGQRRVQIAVRRLEGGVGSQRMAEMAAGTEVTFSGPWGKLPPGADEPAERFLVATDTGITTMLGLVQAARFSPALARTRLLWLRPGPDYFLPEAFLRERIPAALGDFQILETSLPNTPGRIETLTAETLAAHALGGEPVVLLAGAGGVCDAVKATLEARGLAPASVRLEAFFNNSARKAPSATQGA